MNKTLTITVIVLVTVVMGMSTIAPMVPQAFAHEAPEAAHKICENENAIGNLPPTMRVMCLHLR